MHCKDQTVGTTHPSCPKNLEKLNNMQNGKDTKLLIHQYFTRRIDSIASTHFALEGSTSTYLPLQLVLAAWKSTNH